MDVDRRCCTFALECAAALAVADERDLVRHNRLASLLQFIAGVPIDEARLAG